MSIRPPSPPRLAAAALVAGLLLVAAAATSLPDAPLRLLAPLATHVVHLVAAFALGRAVLRLPGAAPREALDVAITSLAAGLVALALLTLAAVTLLGASWWTPWLVDAVAVTTGVAFGSLREGVRRVVEPWKQRELALIVASRLPLHVATCLVLLLHLVPPFLPPTPATGAAALALPAQAALRHDLAAAMAALPGHLPTPSQALLLHGYLAGGAPGALLFGATALGLLVAAAWLHANRHLGDRAAAWTTLVLASTPVLLPVAAREPGTELLLLFAFLAFHEVVDWCQRATGGKIALASIYGGFLLAEAPRGAAAFAGVLAFVFLAQAFIERNGVLRQLPGLLGMTGIAVLVAAPFLALAVARAPQGPLAAVVERHVPVLHAPEPSPRAPAATAAATATAGDEFAPEGVMDVLGGWSRRALLLGPLLLGLLAALPLVPIPAEPVRQAALGALIFGALALLPPPYGGGLFLLAPAAIAAGGTAVALLSSPGIVARAASWFALAALPASAALALASGPDIPLGAGVLLGRVAPGEYEAAHLPDAVLVDAVRTRGIAEGRSVLLVGSLTDAHYPTARRVPALGAGVTPEELAQPPEPVELVAIDRDTASASSLAALSDRVVVATFASGRFALLGLAQDPEAAAAAAVAAEAAAAAAAEAAAVEAAAVEAAAAEAAAAAATAAEAREAAASPAAVPAGASASAPAPASPPRAEPPSARPRRRR